MISKVDKSENIRKLFQNYDVRLVGGWVTVTFEKTTLCQPLTHFVIFYFKMSKQMITQHRCCYSRISVDFAVQQCLTNIYDS